MQKPRLRRLTLHSLDSAQRDLWHSIDNGPRGPSGTFVDPADGSLRGPFNAMLHSPVVGARVAALGEALRFQSSLPRRAIELATITVGAHWRSNFEWHIHQPLALAAGVPRQVADAIQQGRAPAFDSASDAFVHGFAHQLVNTGDVDDATYDAALAAFGERGVVELVFLVGHYCLISFTLNAFHVPVPVGGQAPWPR